MEFNENPCWDVLKTRDHAYPVAQKKLKKKLNNTIYTKIGIIQIRNIIKSYLLKRNYIIIIIIMMMCT